MSRASLVPLVVLSLALTSPPFAQHLDAQTVDAYDQQRYSDNQLDNLVGPIALYPDALLAQVLVAATFPDQVEEAARWVRANGTAEIDDQSWDVSVKSVAHYASALNMMADKSDWTATLGRAYANQSSDVMAAVQRMRRMADSQGNLVTTPQQQVVRDADNYVIVPAQARVIYVPVYDPVVVYTRPIYNVGFASRYWSFGVGFPIGGWLNYDLDWRLRSVYYNGWNDAYFAYGGGWRARSRPFIQITNVYVNPRYRDVYLNRGVIHRSVNYRNVDRYAGVHRDVYFDGRRDGYRNGYRDGRSDDRDRGRNNSPRDGPDARGGFPYGSDLSRGAQPRAERPAATPDGYRNGSERGSPRDSRSSQAAPEYRRNEPSSRSAQMTIAPEAVRSAPRENNGRSAEMRNESYRRDTPSSPRMERSDRRAQSAPRSEPRVEQRAPQQERAREAPSRSNGSSERRAAQPRGSRGNDNGRSTP